MNHVALECWYRFQYSYQLEDLLTYLPQALAALTLNNNDASLYQDSGATTHITLSYVKPYKANDVIYVGNGNKLNILMYTGSACVGELN